jgi:hypothetical protein
MSLPTLASAWIIVSHLIEHAVDDDDELRERLVDIMVRKPFAQVAGDDALNPFIDLFDPLLGAHTQPSPSQQAQAKPATDPAREPDRRRGKSPSFRRPHVR